MTLLLLTLLSLLAAESAVAAVPANAHALGDGWACNQGYKQQGTRCAQTTEQEPQEMRKPSTRYQAPVSDGTIAFKANVESGNASVLKLTDAAVVDIPEGITGSIDTQSRAVIFGDGTDCNIWLEGKRAYHCGFISQPVDKALPARRVNIAPVRGPGDVLVMLDGSMYKVHGTDVKKTSLWNELSEGLIIEADELINLQTGDAVAIEKIRQ